MRGVLTRLWTCDKCGGQESHPEHQGPRGWMRLRGEFVAESQKADDKPFDAEWCDTCCAVYLAAGSPLPWLTTSTKETPMSDDVSADLIEKAAQAMFERGEREGITWGALDLDLDTYRVLARSALDSVASALRAEGAATALNEGRAKYAEAWDDGVDAAFENADDVKSRNPYRRADRIEKENHR